MTITEAPAPTEEKVDPKFYPPMKKLLARENASLWEQGDLLVQYVKTPAQMAEAAQKLQRKATTLKERRDVSEMFSAELRNMNLAWGVYRVLARVTDADERARILRSRKDWTVDEMTVAARDWTQADRERQGIDVANNLSHVERAKTRRGMNIDGISVTGEKVSENKLKLTIKTGSAEVQSFDLPGEFVLVCTISPEDT